MFPKLIQALVLLMALGASALLAQQTTNNNGANAWTLKSGSVEFRLQSDKGASLRLAPAVGAKPLSLALSHDTSGSVEGQGFAPNDLTLISHEVREPRKDCPQLRLVHQHRKLPLEIEVLYTAWGDTGVFTRQSTLRNTGSRSLRMESLPSLAWDLPSGEYTLDYLHRSGSALRQLASETLTYGRKTFVASSGRSTQVYSPWFSLRNEQLGVRCAAQLFPCGNWESFFDRSGGAVRVEMGMRFDFGGAALLQPGAPFQVPAVAFTAATEIGRAHV
jgi:alpha-galactosidase